MNTSAALPQTKEGEVLMFPLEQQNDIKSKSFQSSPKRREEESFSFSIDEDGDEFFVEEEPKFESDVSMVA